MTPKPNGWEEELEDLFSTESTEDGGHYLIASVKEVKSFIHQAILSAEARGREAGIREMARNYEEAQKALSPSSPKEEEKND